jgi:uncharacterized protein YjcR
LISDLSEKYNIRPNKVKSYIKGVKYNLEDDKKQKASDREFCEKRKKL